MRKTYMNLVVYKWIHPLGAEQGGLNSNLSFIFFKYVVQNMIFISGFWKGNVSISVLFLKKKSDSTWDFVQTTFLPDKA